MLAYLSGEIDGIYQTIDVCDKEKADKYRTSFNATKTFFSMAAVTQKTLLI
jgi:hypothetical protein